jgi:hypothetical protein
VCFREDEYEATWAAVCAEVDRCGYGAAVVWQRTDGGYDRHHPPRAADAGLVACHWWRELAGSAL